MLCFDRTLRRRELEGVRANEPELVLVVFVSMVGVSAEPIVLALTMNRLVESLTDALFKRERPVLPGGVIYGGGVLGSDALGTK